MKIISIATYKPKEKEKVVETVIKEDIQSENTTSVSATSKTDAEHED